VAVMTNVTHEHLEFHGSWEQYRDDKANLFRSLDLWPHEKRLNSLKGLPEGEGETLRHPSFAVANADDPSISYFSAATERRTYTYSVWGAEADISVKSMESTATGTITKSDFVPPGISSYPGSASGLFQRRQRYRRSFGGLAAFKPTSDGFCVPRRPITSGSR